MIFSQKTHELQINILGCESAVNEKEKIIKIRALENVGRNDALQFADRTFALSCKTVAGKIDNVVRGID